MATESDSAESPSRGQDDSDGTTKSGAKKAASKKAPAKKAAKKSSPRQASASKAPSKKMSALAVARSAAQQLAELTGRAPESVIGIERSEDGWTVELEVVESRRIPDSTDILATYRVEVDEDGDLQGYHRVDRYVRGKSSARGDGGR